MTPRSSWTVRAILMLLLAAAALPAQAQIDLTGAVEFGRSEGGLSRLSVTGLIVNIGNFLLGLVIVLAMLALVIGGVLYIAALGDEKRISQAKQILLGALVGTVIAILHGLIMLTLCGILNVPECGGITAPLEDFGQLLENIGNFLLGLVAFLAMAAAVWGGIRYITALGDESQIAEAKRILLGAVIGIIYAGMHVVVVMVACEVANADLPGCPSGDPAQELSEVILSAVGILLALLAPVAVGAIAYGAYLYITSTGEEARASRAKQVLLYTALGIALTITAAIIVNVIINIFI